MEWENIKPSLESLYFENGFYTHFNKNESYLKSAFYRMEELWEYQFQSIEKVNYVMLSEAPLWGENQNYIYNPKTKFSQFFYKSDLEKILEKPIKSKNEFLGVLRDIGFLILDISPFALNENDTVLNYRSISGKDYRNLVISTMPIYFNQKLKTIKTKSTPETKYFFRYKRVMNLFIDIVSETLEKEGLIKSDNEIQEVSKMGGGIDMIKLKNIMVKYIS